MAARLRATFFFDLADPGTYLAAERVDRALAGVTWRPASRETLLRCTPGFDARVRGDAERRARALRLPLVWPERQPEPVVGHAMRAAAFAEEQRRGAPFVLAASRLAFCGGYDLDDPEVLAEAAAAADLRAGRVPGRGGRPGPRRRPATRRTGRRDRWPSRSG